MPVGHERLEKKKKEGLLTIDRCLRKRGNIFTRTEDGRRDETVFSYLFFYVFFILFFLLNCDRLSAKKGGEKESSWREKGEGRRKKKRGDCQHNSARSSLPECNLSFHFLIHFLREEGRKGRRGPTTGGGGKKEGEGIVRLPLRWVLTLPLRRTNTRCPTGGRKGEEGRTREKRPGPSIAFCHLRPLSHSVRNCRRPTEGEGEGECTKKGRGGGGRGGASMSPCHSLSSHFATPSWAMKFRLLTAAEEETDKRTKRGGKEKGG